MKPTCVTRGYTTYTCTVGSGSYTDSIKNARGHWYGPWTSDEGDTRSADCRRCGYTHMVECASVYEVKRAEDSAALSVCPICGKMNELLLMPFEAATIAAIDNHAIPRGERIVRGLPNPFDGVLYVLTAVYERAGKIEPFSGRVSVTVPLDLEEGIAFRVVRVDAASDAEGERTNVPFTYEDGLLTFETDAGGLFLLVPAE